MDREADFKFYQELSVGVIPAGLRFRKPARTSRGTMHTRACWILQVSHPGCASTGAGECAPLFGLSVESPEDMDRGLKELAEHPALVLDPVWAAGYPSIVMGMETAVASMLAFKPWLPFFVQPPAEPVSIPINGLVWMNSAQMMEEEALARAASGFSCIKLKIGGVKWEDELHILRMLRRMYPPDRMVIRVDANGAFSTEQALRVMDELAALQVHSIEQPIAAGQWDTLARLCRNAPVPVALDEELIGVALAADRDALLDRVRPAYIILKPSLHGGFAGCDDWISRASRRGIGWWATSALESSIGLNAIAQWTAFHKPSIPQGLGTGSLFERNFEPVWEVRSGNLCFLENAAPGDWLISSDHP